ncbi:hypothetical protein [Endozoicomonas sp. ONNA2]|uniref:hypothetical protein n=1 Tax=Endozoicomonas sp. ONNA2 TaxID=2828741 RepID=UPI0021498516|nr:hypothetical protein [Endozoicomonas sp. ONNA2]
MNIFRGIQGLSCLHRQPNPDTPSVTASGQWTTTEPGRLLPRPREVERNALLQAARCGRLAIRYIASAEEASNFDGTPRSFTLALQGMPSEKPADQHKWRIGIVDPKCLYIYKKDADTRRPEHGTAADKLDVKLLSDLQSLDEKCKEIKHRAWWEVYPWQSSSGHLGADGIFSLPKLKPGKYGASLTVSVNPYGPLPHPKIVVTHYRNADIKCFFVERSNYKNISDILHQKRECEQALGIEPLPLVVFCCLTGSVEVCYDDELDSRHLAMIENSLNSFVSSHKIRKIMKLLPMPLQAKALSSGFTIPPNDQHKWQQAIELVSNPGHYSYPELLALKESGLPIHRCFLHEGTVTSLLDIFLMSETDRYNNLPGQQEIPAQEDADRLLRLLLHSGAILAERGWSLIRTMGDCEQLSMPLAIFNDLVAAFAPFKALTLQNLWNIPLTGCPGGVVEFDQICKKCPDRELQNGLKEELSPKRLLQKPTLDTIQSHLLALFHYGAVLDEDVLETVKSDLGTYYRDDTTIIENLSVAGFIDWLEKLRQEHQSHPFYLDWQAHVKEAREEIKKKKQSLELPDYPHASVAPALQFMVDAFSEPPGLAG